MPGMDVVSKEMMVVVEEAPDPINDDDPSPKGNVVPDHLRMRQMG